MPKIDLTLFTAASAQSAAATPCPQCGHALVLRQGKHGPFLGCSHYPECTHHQPLHGHSEVEKILDGSQCPACGQPLAIKKGRYGLFIGCTAYPACHHIASPQTADDTQITCPACQRGHLLTRTSRYGKTFYACSDYPACRYALNDPPHAQPCPACGWAVMIAKTRRGQPLLVCPQKQCGHHMPQV
ncbi:MAG: topoisomerase DNA-binding C4 zinc finger domain-containing protein [Aeromonas sp.]